LLKAASDGAEKVNVPVPPTAGVTTVNPGGAVADTKVVPDGVASVNTTFVNITGPLFTVMV
jgi:hypothetical protein